MADIFLAVLVLLGARSGIPAAEVPAQFTLGDYEFIAPQGWQVQRQAKAELSETTPLPPTAGIRTAARAWLRRSSRLPRRRLERLCMVRTDETGMENEACYRRQDR